MYSGRETGGEEGIFAGIEKRYHRRSAQVNKQSQCRSEAAQPRRYWKIVKLFVAAKSTKGGYYTCTVNDTYVNCVCNSYKRDSVCKHSITVAIKENIIESHLQRLKPSDCASRAGLVQPSSRYAGKKGAKTRICGMLNVQENHQVNTHLHRLLLNLL